MQKQSIVYKTVINCNLKCSLLFTRSLIIEIVDLGANKNRWLIANADASGFYRVLYSRALYKALTRQLRDNHNALTIVDRASLINDAFAFLNSGHLSIDVVFELIEYTTGNVRTAN